MNTPPNENWKRQFLITGALVGAALGFTTAFLMARAAEEDGRHGPPDIRTMDVIRATLGVIGAMRGIAALGNRTA